MLEHLVGRLITSALKKSFRRVARVGEVRAADPARPLVLYANHHNFHDGYLLWLLNRRLGRRNVVWMEEWDRYPLFAPVGAFPFPVDDPARRAATIRATARRMRRDPLTGLAYFPEGKLHRAEEGLLPFDSAHLGRLDRMLGHPLWMPVAIRTTWEGTSRPTALLSGGEARPFSGREEEILSALWLDLDTSDPSRADSLLEGRQGPNEGRGFSAARSFFTRYLQ